MLIKTFSTSFSLDHTFWLLSPLKDAQYGRLTLFQQPPLQLLYTSSNKIYAHMIADIQCMQNAWRSLSPPTGSWIMIQ